jgi:hypothetical protein
MRCAPSLLLLAPATALAIALLTAASALAQTSDAIGPDLPTSGLGFLGNPTAWATTVFHEALIALLRSTSTDVVGLVDWLVASSGNVISQTPPGLSYDNPAVHSLWGGSRLVANGLLGVVALVGGVNIITRPHIRSPYHTVMELLPRLALGALLINSSLDWGRFTIDLNNALCQSFGVLGLPAWDLVGGGLMGFVVSLVALLVYLVMGLLLLIQMLMRLALVDVLLAIAPLALVCWVLPQTYVYAQAWFTTFFGTVFAQFVQVVVLHLGTALIGGLATITSPELATSAVGSHQAVLGLLLGIAVLHLARGVPRLLPGYVGLGAGLRPSLGMSYRGAVQIASAASTSRRLAALARAVTVRV